MIGRDEHGPWVVIEPIPGERIQVRTDMLRELCIAWMAQCDYAEKLNEEEPRG